MPSDVGKELARTLIELNMNILRWNREHIENSFNKNGKKKACDLTMRQFHVLMFIRTTGINTISDLSKWLNLSKSSMSIMMNKLKQNGYLCKSQAEDDDDGRKSYFYLTEKGLEEVKAAEERILENTAACFASFSEETARKFSSHLRELNELVKTGGFGE